MPPPVDSMPVLAMAHCSAWHLAPPCAGNYAVSGGIAGCEAVEKLAKSFKARWGGGGVQEQQQRGSQGGAAGSGRCAAFCPAVQINASLFGCAIYISSNPPGVSLLPPLRMQDDCAAGSGGRVPHRLHGPRAREAAGGAGQHRHPGGGHVWRWQPLGLV